MSSTESEERRPQPGFWLVPVLTLGTFVTMLNAMALGPFLPVIADDLDTSVSALGQIPALSMLLAAMLGLVAGPLADQLGPRRALIGGLTVVVISSIGIGLAPGYLFLLVAALIGGAARAVSQPMSIVIASTYFQGDRQRWAIGWVVAGVSGAVIVGIPGLTTLAEHFGWRTAFAVLAGTTAILLMASVRSIAPDIGRPDMNISIRSILGAYRPLACHPPSAGLIGATLLGSASIWMMATYLGAFYAERFDYSIQQIGWVYLVAGVGLFSGSLLAGGRLGRLPLRPLLIAARLVTGIAIGALLILPVSSLAGIGLLAVQGLSTGIGAIAVTVLLTRESPAGRATTLTLNIAATSLGTALGSALGGLLLSISGFWLIGLFAFLLSLISVGLVWWFQEEGAGALPGPAREVPI